MKIQNSDFGPVLGASGVQGFFGEGYRFHSPLQSFELDFTDMTFVAKTATLNPREGNMPLTDRYTPREWIPLCIRTKILRGVILNAVGVSNPGIKSLIDCDLWQRRRTPFFLSIMSVAPTRGERLAELRALLTILATRMDEVTPYGVQINLSCPNTKSDPHALIDEVVAVLDIVEDYDIPTLLKLSIASAPVKVVAEFTEHEGCNGICVSNTIPFGWRQIDWRRVWGSTTSPLAYLGGGGLSGAPLRPLVCEWIARLRDEGFEKPINGGGGILSIEDVDHYHRAGASSIFLGSVVVLRPWRVKSIIQYAHSLTWR